MLGHGWHACRGSIDAENMCITKSCGMTHRAEDLAPQVGRAQELTAQVVSFLEARDGSAATADLVDHFQPRVPAAQMPLFRQLLKQVRSGVRHS